MWEHDRLPEGGLINKTNFEVRIPAFSMPIRAGWADGYHANTNLSLFIHGSGR